MAAMTAGEGRKAGVVLWWSRCFFTYFAWQYRTYRFFRLVHLFSLSTWRQAGRQAGTLFLHLFGAVCRSFLPRRGITSCKSVFNDIHTCTHAFGASAKVERVRAEP